MKAPTDSILENPELPDSGSAAAELPPPSGTDALLETVLERMSAALESGHAVKISAFGTFIVRQKGKRVGRNPKTGIEVPILPRKVLAFRPSQVLKARINGDAAPAEDDAA